MESLVLHLPKILSKKKIKFSELFDQSFTLPDAYNKYREEECTIITTTEAVHPFSLKPSHINEDLLELLSFAGYTLYPNDQNIISINNKKLFSTLAYDSSLFDRLCKRHDFVSENRSIHLYCKEDKDKDLNIEIVYEKIHDIYMYTDHPDYQKECSSGNFSFLNGHNLSVKKERTSSILNLLPKYKQLYDKIYLSQFTGKINFNPASIVGPHVSFSYYIPNTLSYEKNMSFFHNILESIKEIDLKDPHFNKSSSLGKPVSINKRINLLYNYFLTTSAKQDIDNVFGEDPVIDSNNKYSDKYTCFSPAGGTVHPDPVALSYIKRASFTKDQDISTILDNTFIFEKYLSSITSFISTDNDVHTSIINLLIYGTYLHNINTKTPNNTFKRTYDVRIKILEDNILYFNTCFITLKTNFKQHILSNSSLFNPVTSFYPMFYNSNKITQKQTTDKNFILKSMGK